MCAQHFLRYHALYVAKNNIFCSFTHDQTILAIWEDLVRIFLITDSLQNEISWIQSLNNINEIVFGGILF